MISGFKNKIVSMLNGISWGNYFYCIETLCVLYYLIVTGYFYRDSFKKLLTGRPAIISSNAQKVQMDIDNESTQFILDEASAFCHQMNQYDYDHSDLLMGLKKIINNHSNITTDGDDQTKEVLQLELEKRCSIYLSPAEMDWLWSAAK